MNDVYTILTIATAEQQFYLQDAYNDGDVPYGLYDTWFQMATADFLTCGADVIAIYTVSDTLVTIQINLQSSAPPLDIVDYDYVVETNFDAYSGEISVSGSSQDTFSISIAPGSYAVRISSRGRCRCADNLHKESYTFTVWPSIYTEPSIHKMEQAESGLDNKNS